MSLALQVVARVLAGQGQLPLGGRVDHHDPGQGQDRPWCTSRIGSIRAVTCRERVGEWCRSCRSPGGSGRTGYPAAPGGPGPRPARPPAVRPGHRPSRRPATAAHMASTGALRARSSARSAGRPGGPACRARWPCRPPGPAAAASHGVSRRVVDEVDHQLAGAAAAPGRPASRPVPPATSAMPGRGGVDHQVAARCVVGRRPPGPTAPARAAAACRPVRRAVDHHHLGGAGVGQGGDHRPGRATGPDHQAARARRGRTVRLRARAATSPAPSVLSPSQPSAVVGHAVDGARAARPPGCDGPTAAATSSLWGMVTDSPRIPRARAPARAAPARPGGHGEADRHPVEPELRRRRRCGGSGDSEWATGYPMTPTTRVAGRQPSRPTALRPVARHAPVSRAQPSPRWMASASLACWPAKVSENASVPSWCDHHEVEPRRRPAGAGRPAGPPRTGSRSGVGGRPLWR